MQFDSGKAWHIYVVLGCQLLISLFVIYDYDGIGKEGDSVLHYLYAKFAIKHPELFFNHWAKPIYVLLACLFAQFGFTGIKLFNVLVMMLTSLYTYKTCVRLQLDNAIISAILLLFSPLVFTLTFSGFTEPLFALMLIVGIYLMLAEHKFTSCMIISFLPFARSEGLFYVAIFAAYLLLKRNIKLIPALLMGHVVYAIAGIAIHQDILWVLNKIPYARLNSNYGSGTLLHFVEQMIYVTGVPVYILFWIGVTVSIYYVIRRRKSVEFVLFIFAGFFVFLMSHTAFWYLGIFNSMGLKRVLICVAPFASILALVGYNALINFFEKSKAVKLVMAILLIGYVVVFPFTSNRAAVDWNKDLSLTTEQQLASQVASLIDKDVFTKKKFFYTNPFLSEVLRLDHFDTTKRMELNSENMKYIQSGDIIVWENWFAVVECGITKDMLDGNSKIMKLNELKSKEQNREISYAVYRCK